MDDQEKRWALGLQPNTLKRMLQPPVESTSQSGHASSRHLTFPGLANPHNNDRLRLPKQLGQQFLEGITPLSCHTIVLLGWLISKKASDMKNIKVLGSGCKNCETTAKLIQIAAEQAGVEIELEKVTDMTAIMTYGVMSTPGVVVDGQVVHAGGLPGPGQIRAWVSHD
jgi:small redox-active disulfide protein 2